MNRNGPNKYQYLHHQMQKLLNDPEIPVMGYAVCIIEGGKISFECAGGYRVFSLNHPAQCLPMNTQTRYRIASVSKMITAVAIMQLAEQGKLSLDEDVSQYLGFPLRNPYYPDVIITPRLLMAHYGSICDGSVYSIPSGAAIWECFLPGGRYYRDGEHFAAPDGIHHKAPGHYYTYSNLNYGLLGTILERLTGQRFDQYVRTHVLTPMGIQGSFHPGDFTQEQIQNLATIYTYVPSLSGGHGTWLPQTDDFRGQIQPQNMIWIGNPDLGTTDCQEDISDYQIGTNGTLFSPQGGLRISAHELGLFALMLINEGIADNRTRILKPSSVKELFTPVWVYSPKLDNRDPSDSAHAYGAGINIISTAIGGDHMVNGVDNITMFGHIGSAYGLMSACYIDPVWKNGFAYAFNGTGGEQRIYSGRYSGRFIWHERTMSAIYHAIFQ